MTNNSPVRCQFTLRSLFAATTLTALVAAAGYDVWQSFDIRQAFDALATLIVAVGASAALCTLLVLATLPFAYRRAVSEVDDQVINAPSESPAPVDRDRSESNPLNDSEQCVTVRVMVPLLLACIGAAIGAPTGLDWTPTNHQPSLLRGAIGAAIGLLGGLAYVAVLPDTRASALNSCDRQ